MRKLAWLSAALIASVLVYLAVFAVVERPLTLGDLTRQLDFKLAAAQRAGSPKILVFAGSNGRYSHRCSYIAVAAGRPCVNVAIAAGIGIDFQLAQYTAVLQRGDAVYMPLEYEQYSASEGDMHLGAQNAVMVRHRPDFLHALSPSRLVQTYAAFDLPYFVRGLIEMSLARAKFKRRTGGDMLTPDGDESGHTVAKATAYAAALAETPLPRTTVPERSHALDVLQAFLTDARHRGVMVIGGLPTVPLGTQIAPDDLARVRRLFEDAGQRFVTTPTLSRYPIACFFDGPYHLNEACQAAHSQIIGPLIAEQLSRPIVPVL